MSDETVNLILTDFQDNSMYRQLKNKFENQVKGFVLWTNRKHNQPLKYFLPIEFSKDYEYVRKYIRGFPSIFLPDSSDSIHINTGLVSSLCSDLLCKYPDLVKELKRNYRIEQTTEIGQLVQENLITRDREIALEAVKKNGNDLMKHRKFYKDREIVLEASKQNGQGLYYADVSFRNDREIILESLKRNEHTSYYMSEELNKDRSLALESVKYIAGSFRYINALFRKERDFVLEAVSLNGLVIQYLSGEFADDREIVMRALKQNGNAIEHAKEIFRNDRELIQEVIRYHLKLDTSTPIERDQALEYNKKFGSSLIVQLEEFRNEKDIILTALNENKKRINDGNHKERSFLLDMLKKNWQVFEMATISVKNEGEVFLMAFDVNCSVFEIPSNSDTFLQAYEYRNMILETSDQIRLNKEIAWKVIRQNLLLKHYFSDISELTPQIYKYLEMEHLNTDKDFMVHAVKINREFLKYANEDLKDDEDFMLNISKITGSIKEASIRLKDDPQFLLKSLDYCRSFINIPEKFRSDRNFMMEAVKKSNHPYLQYASDLLRSDRELVLNAVKSKGSNFESASKYLKQDREIIIEALKDNASYLSELSEEFKFDRELVLIALTSHDTPAYLFEQDFLEKFSNDREILLEIIKKKGDTIKLDFMRQVPLLKDREFILQAVEFNSQALNAFRAISEKGQAIIHLLAEKYGISQHFDEDLYQKRLSFEYLGARLPSSI